MEREKVIISEQFSRLTGIIFSSSKTFEELNNRPTWLVAFFTIGFGVILITFLISPFMMQAQTASMPSDMSLQQIENVLKFAKRFQIIGIVLSPLFLIIKFIFTSAILWLIIQLFSEVDFKRMFSVVVHCGVILFLGSIITFIILKLRGLQSIKSAADVQVSLGLDLFIQNPDLNFPLKAFLSNINVFSVWWIILVGLGISIIAKISRTKATIITAFFWLFSTMIQVGIASLIGSLGKIG